MSKDLMLNKIGQATMSSVELAELCSVRHDHFMVKVPKVLGESLAPEFLGTSYYTNGAGNSVPRPCYNLPKREACLMAMSYSYELQAKVYDKMTELEEANKQKLPDFNNPVIAARAWADAKEETMEALMLVNDLKEENSIIKPKAKFVDDFVEFSAGSYGFRSIAKLIKQSIPRSTERLFRAFLTEEKIEYRVDGNYQPYAKYLNNGCCEIKTGTYNDKTYKMTRFTPKGVVWVTSAYRDWFIKMGY